MADTDKVLILYASAGHGHEKAAKAVASAYGAEAAGRVSCVDMLSLTRFGFGPRYSGLYLFLIRVLPWLWGWAYYLTDVPFIYWLVRPLRRWMNHFFAGGVERRIEEERPDVVISTHFMGGETAGFIKRRRSLSFRSVTVVTDYRPHAIWINPETDLYCVAVQGTAEELVRRGVPHEKIAVTGIPIEAKFSAAVSREALRRDLGLEPGAFTVLLASGGGGVGLVEPLLERLMILEPPMRFLVVCGTNKALRDRLEARYRGRSNLRLFGFVDNVHELMAASDLVVGKGGGLTITESLAMGKPMVLIGAVPGQETRNVEVLVEKQAAQSARTIAEAAGFIQRYQKDSAFYARTQQAIEALRRPGAAQAVRDAARGAA